MLEKIAIRKFIKGNPTINFSNKEVADIEEKFAKSLKLLRTLGLVKVYDLTKDEDVDVGMCDNIHNIIIEVKTSIDGRTSRSKQENYQATISVPLEFGGPSVFDYEASYIGFVCDILVAFRYGFGYLK